MREDMSDCMGINLWGEDPGSPGFLGVTGKKNTEIKVTIRWLLFYLF